MISTKVYLYLLLIIIILLALSLFYIMSNNAFTKTIKVVIFWYIIILELNLINIYSVLKFYEKAKLRKGPKGLLGNVGPRGFRGQSEMCSSCGIAGQTNIEYANTLNKQGEDKESDPMIQEGKCIFPFIHNYQYVYNCTDAAGMKPPNSTTDEVGPKGWCATSINNDKTVKTYGFCKTSDILSKKIRNMQYRKSRQDYLQNNRGILDIKIFAENTMDEARRKCNSLQGNYEFYDKDMNDGTGGKFIHMCIKRGLGSRGVQELEIIETTSDAVLQRPGNNYEYISFENDDSNTGPIDLNMDADSNPLKTKLYMKKKMGRGGYIQDIKINKESEGGCGEYDNYEQLGTNDLNKGTHLGPTDELRLCINSTVKNIQSIDTSFVYKDGNLYFFRGDMFYLMKSNVENNSIEIANNYPKNIALKWGGGSSNANNNTIEGQTFIVKDCSKFDGESSKCIATSNCDYDTLNNKCEAKSNYDAVFTWGKNNKTYFFKGGLVYLYDDKKMRMATGYPKKIDNVFKGVPSNINAAFTWAKDKRTYFFKGPMYYKYDDVKNKVERGFPKKADRRWVGMPGVIDAIFSLNYSLEPQKKGTNHTYVISGQYSWYIDPLSDKLENKKNISERFVGLEVSNTDLPQTTQV